MKKVLCIGELLIDFICTDIGVSLSSGDNFLKKAGGAPANVTSAISRLGGKASFGGSVGQDPFGDFLENSLVKEGVDTTFLKREGKPTTMSFVSVQEDGERDFVFARGADEIYEPDEKEAKEMESFDIFHFGSATALLGGSLRDTYDKFFAYAEKSQKLICFDPNYRDNLWAGRDQEFIELSKKYIAKSDIVKVSDAEACLITGISDVKDAALVLSKLGETVLLVTLGKEGTLIIAGDHVETVGSVKIKSVDSTGAGDAFVGALLYKMACSDSKDILKNNNAFSNIVKFANAVGALTCTEMGATEALPTLDKVNKFLQ
ncbi:carbohydrate kinase [Clostridium tyrobutyricum]|uniref:carbohydrate kinase family protein n=1 Tax=Clostridium tyrobutyricum TaxID=1519 RepID=UPI001C387616|nr:carbohydrate kinase [Clostridium tyrobutyricum]MBV4431812.1 carbohydrate kinase [Clostridium tyrobutyricum]